MHPDGGISFVVWISCKFFSLFLATGRGGGQGGGFNKGGFSQYGGGGQYLKKIELNHRTKQEVCFHFAVNRRASIQFLFITSVAYFFWREAGLVLSKATEIHNGKGFWKELVH